MTIAQHLQCWDRRPSQDMSLGGAIEIRFQSPLRGYYLLLPNHPALEVLDYYRLDYYRKVPPGLE
ncbi:hypothetical protein I41_34910 [Lacipirellula limnantheis]|uniref:Uncharacterized protein n=1 Tax=Lacipirellula limnantheis TaxID=2528024 RepID=A0A517U0Y6_9BACT|nr:hypothetical protein I41_34910 [Lacipirellula limnantheis]